jgi:predicted XRE-type DNA-binding protein
MNAYKEAKNLKELCRLLGVPLSEAPKIKMRIDLVGAIQKQITRKGYTHQQASERADVGRTVITAIMNGHLEKITTDRLIDIAQALGLKVRLEIAS